MLKPNNKNQTTGNNEEKVTSSVDQREETPLVEFKWTIKKILVVAFIVIIIVGFIAILVSGLGEPAEDVIDNTQKGEAPIQVVIDKDTCIPIEGGKKRCKMKII